MAGKRTVQGTDPIGGFWLDTQNNENVSRWPLCRLSALAQQPLRAGKLLESRSSSGVGIIGLMLNLSHLRRLYGGAKTLGLNLPDTFLWFWNYYASRLPGAGSRATSCVEIGIPSMALRLRIRNNGFDYDVVEEIFARNAYKMGLDNVKRLLDLRGNIGLASLFFAQSFSRAHN